MAPPDSLADEKHFHVGTLIYSPKAMAFLFAWLLWGDFAFSLFENIFGRFIPLYLKELNASNTLIGIMTGSLAGVVNILFLPGISKWSDNLRTKWGRRIPVLAIFAPLTVGSLILMGFAPELAHWLHKTFLGSAIPALSEYALILTLLCVFVVAFHYFNMVLVNCFNWLLRDVVPQHFMARFLSWFRAIGTAAGILFSLYVFPYILSHRREVCVGIGIFYLIVFLIMCLKVKEGDYPPPPPKGASDGALRSFFHYFRSCFTVPIYRNFFFAIMAVGLSSCAGPFVLLFYQDSLKISLTDLGFVFTVSSTITFLALVPIGWLCDKFTAIRISVIGLIGLFTVAILSFFFVRDKESLLLFSILSAPATVCWTLGSATMAMQLFPSEKFGQLSSAVNIFAMGITIFGNFAIGIFMDIFDSNYRLVYLWIALAGLAFLPMIRVWRDWNRLGGATNYVPPAAE